MQTYGVVLGRVLVSLQDLDPVPLAKPLDLPHRQVSEFLVKVKKKKMKQINFFFPLNFNDERNKLSGVFTLGRFQPL